MFCAVQELSKILRSLLCFFGFVFFVLFPQSAVISALSLANLLPEILFVQEGKSISVVIRAKNSAAGSLCGTAEFTDHVLLLAVLALAPLHRSMPG